MSIKTETAWAVCMGFSILIQWLQVALIDENHKKSKSSATIPEIYLKCNENIGWLCLPLPIKLRNDGEAGNDINESLKVFRICFNDQMTNLRWSNNCEKNWKVLEIKSEFDRISINVQRNNFSSEMLSLHMSCIHVILVPTASESIRILVDMFCEYDTFWNSIVIETAPNYHGYISKISNDLENIFIL